MSSVKSGQSKLHSTFVVTALGARPYITYALYPEPMRILAKTIEISKLSPICHCRTFSGDGIYLGNSLGDTNSSYSINSEINFAHFSWSYNSGYGSLVGRMVVQMNLYFSHSFFGYKKSSRLGSFERANSFRYCITCSKISSSLRVFSLYEEGIDFP